MAEIDELRQRVKDLEAVIAESKLRADAIYTRAVGVETRTDAFEEAHTEAQALTTEATALVTVLDGA